MENSEQKEPDKQDDCSKSSVDKPKDGSPACGSSYHHSNMSSSSSSSNEDNDEEIIAEKQDTGNGQSPPDLESEMYCYFIKSYKADLDRILMIPLPKAPLWFPFEIDYVGMMGKCPGSIRLLHKFPDKAIEIADLAAAKALQHRFDKARTSEMIFKKMSVKLVHARFCGLPNHPGMNLVKNVFPGSEYIGEFMTVVGTVTKITTRCIIQKQMNYHCSKCKFISIVKSERNTYDDLPAKLPGNYCTTPECKKGSLSIINPMSVNQDPRIRKPYQEITIEEKPHGAVGTNVKTLRVTLEDDLVDSCIHQDDVAITGIFYVRHKPFKRNEVIDLEFAFKANHIKVKNPVDVGIDLSTEKKAAFEYFWKLHEGDPYYGRNLILKSLCPKIYEMPIPKLALAIIVAGGVSRDNVKRKEGHLLFSGDPGTGKSELIKYATQLVPRSLYVTGVGTSTAGLTVSVVQEDGRWTMVPGAMIIANGGILAIDEFSTLSRQNQLALNEGLEQQTVSIAKAGLVGTLPAKCSVIASSNPKKSSLKSDIAEKGLDKCLGLDSTVISRFDLVILLNDTPDREWDSMLCDRILWEDQAVQSNPIPTGESNLEWTLDDLRSYFAYLRGKSPEMTSDAHDVITKYYLHKRSEESRNVSRTTPRMYDSIVRLSDGHAKLMNQSQTMVSDVVVAISLMEAALDSSQIIKISKDCRLTRYPVNPLEDYAEKARTILNAIGAKGTSMMEATRLAKIRKIKEDRKVNPFQPPPVQLNPKSQATCSDSSSKHVPESLPLFTNRTGRLNEEEKDCATLSDVEAAWKEFFMSDEKDDDGIPIVKPCALRISQGKKT